MARSLGVTQKTAWFMDHRLRLAMRTESFNAPLSGEVEADETFIGGKRANKHSNRKGSPSLRGPRGKAIVMGMLERDGEVRALVVPSTRKRHLQAVVRANVAPGAALYTDASYSYQGLEDDYGHGFVDHAVQYVNGRISTNGMENFWSSLKRGLTGIYHSVEAEHLDRYVDEFSYRFNTWKMSDGGRFVASVPRIAGKRLMYAELIAKG